MRRVACPQAIHAAFRKSTGSISGRPSKAEIGPGSPALPCSIIAQLSGVSTATVDRVLNQRAGVRGATVQRVMQAAISLGYLPQAEAHATLQAQPQPLRLMVLIPEGSNRFLQMLGDVIGYAQEHWAPFNVRCQAAYIESFNPDALAKALLHHGKRCDGIAFMALEHPVVREAVAQLADQCVPTVTLISDLSSPRRAA